MHIREVTCDLLPPLTGYRFVGLAVETQYPADHKEPLTPASEPSSNEQQTDEYAWAVRGDATTNQNHSLGGSFIHAPCTKGFTNPSKVRKPHWVKKHSDFAMTTGHCAKHNKPSITWYKHLNCKDGLPILETTKSAHLVSRQHKIKATVAGLNGLMAPNLSQHNTTPGFLALNGLPHKVTKPLNVGTVTISIPKEPGKRFHTHGILFRSNFDSLLTAINLVSQVDAPKPQGRTNSIALHLNAQATAAEVYGQRTPFVPLASTLDSRRICPVVPTVLIRGDVEMEETSSPHSTLVDSTAHSDGSHRPSLALSDTEESYTAAVISRPFKPVRTTPSGRTKKKLET